MIVITDKKDCCGCSACAQICPKQCITMSADNEGFLYPAVDTEICINCGLCEKVCPVLNQSAPHPPLATYATKNNNEEVRMKSSSGGTFSLLAEQVISERGVVFGAKFDTDWQVVHAYTDTIDGLEVFRGSKYVQSTIGESYKAAERFLIEGRKVLFSGTPCQIAGLKKFLRKEYAQLLTIEVVCHGVPSPMVWGDYLKYRQTNMAKRCENGQNSSSSTLPTVTEISFRDKTNGWRKFGLKICFTTSESTQNSESANSPICELTPFSDDLFMRGFLRNIYLRPSCYHCAARQGKSGADLSIADYWGIHKIHPQFYDNKGVGLTLINTEKGVEYYNRISSRLECCKSELERALKYNPVILGSVKEPKQRAEFWSRYNHTNFDLITQLCPKKKPSFITRCKQFIKKLIHKV